MEVRKMVTVPVAAAELGVSAKHIYALVAEKQLSAIDISASGNGGPNSWRICMESVRRFRQSRAINHATD